MGVLSLHNECPPTGYLGADAPAIAGGLVVGEQATSASLRAIADCIQSLAYLDDTVASVVTAWGAATAGSGNGVDLARLAADVLGQYEQSFAAIEQTSQRIALSVRKYRELETYAQRALADGRGANFEAAYRQRGEDGFAGLVRKRIEGLRRLAIRVDVLRQLRPYGAGLLQANNFPDFFLLLMQPIRDMSTSVNELYDEIVRGALLSHSAMLQTCQLADESTQPAAPVGRPQPTGIGSVA